MRPMNPVLPPVERAVSTVRADELARFNRLAATWWDASGPMRPLHALNALRLSRVRAWAEAHHGRPAGSGLAGLRCLDLGCGAGLLSEPLARAGARVTGIDAAERNIAVARAHAAAAGLAPDYRCGEPAQALAADERFDVILLLEVVEHVADVPAFVAQALDHLAPGGLVIASTINRTLRSWAVAIVGAEWLLRLLPRGTHRWRQFVTPGELATAMAGRGLRQHHLTGVQYQPWRHQARWCDSTAVNYMASYAAAPLR
jgi:2-polyprenyl-6-hydroxyphenyl methylase/3-demethylubiquinone-9 3-methyltransferase